MEGLSKKQKEKLSNQIEYWTNNTKKRFRHIEKDEIKSHLTFFIYERKDKFDSSKGASYITYLINLVNYGALNFRTIQSKISKNETALSDKLLNSDKFIYYQNFQKRIEEYEIKKKLIELSKTTDKVFDLFKMGYSIEEILKELQTTRYEVNKILLSIEKVVKEYYGN